MLRYCEAINITGVAGVVFFSIPTLTSVFDKFACGPAVKHTPGQNCELEPITHPKVGHL